MSIHLPESPARRFHLRRFRAGAVPAAALIALSYALHGDSDKVAPSCAVFAVEVNTTAQRFAELHAARLLDSGSFLVGEVADRLGLDPFQFSRVFKRIHGISPSEFKDRHGNTR